MHLIDGFFMGDRFSERVAKIYRLIWLLLRRIKNFVFNFSSSSLSPSLMIGMLFLV